jgi:GNAT superfamily N-acetyltransferase
MTVRAAAAADLDVLAQIWLDGWRDAHLAIVPAELARHRTLDSFKTRLAAALDDVRVADGNGATVGFVMVRGDELYQFYVARTARGTGLAGLLMADAERELTRRGVDIAWLSCAIGNDRAARFYEKCGWRRAGVMTDHSVIEGGTFPIETWRYEKSLR